MKLLRLVCLAAPLLLHLHPAAQPANDDCSGATVLIQNSNCSPSPGTTIDATQSVPAITCQGLEGYADDDVWYVFISTTHSPFITVTPSPGFDAVVDLRSSPCNGTTIDCADSKGPGGTENIYTYGLLIGETYYIRIYSYGYGTAAQGNFTVCVYGYPPPPPVNDQCSAATGMLEKPYCDPYLGTTISASQSVDPVPCEGATGSADDDVWYVFTATTSNPTITVEATPLFDPVVDLREGPCNGTSMFCADEGGAGFTEHLYAVGLSVGESYLIRVYSFGSDPNSPEEFTICIHETFCRTCPDFDFEISPGPDWQVHHSSTGSLGCNLYQFDAREGVEYTFKTGCSDGASAGFDTFLQILGMACDSLTSDDNSCESGLSKISWISDYDGPAYLKIRGADSDEFGSYSMSYKITGAVTVPELSQDASLADQIRIYPNPATESVRIETKQGLITRILIFDAIGSFIRQVGLNSPSASFTVETLSVPRGLYFLAIETNMGWVHKKLHIQNQN